MAVTTDDFKAQVATIKELRLAEDIISGQKKEASRMVEEAETKMLAMLEEAGLDSFRCELGNVGRTIRLSIKTPKSPEDRAAFFGYIKSKGLFDDMITVHSATLNSFYKDEFDQAKARGDADFKIPGLLEETMTPILWFRKP